MKKYILFIIVTFFIYNILYAQDSLSYRKTHQDTIANIEKNSEPKTSEPWYRIEAYSNYVVFLLGIIFGLIGLAIKNKFWGKKPSVIRVVKSEEESLLDLSPKARDRLTIKYNNQSITEFHRMSFSIYNMGTQTIKNVKVKILLEGLEKSDFFELSSINSHEDVKLILNATEGEHSVQFQIPFLNSMQIHKDKLTFDIYTTKKVKVEVFGRGAGWSIRYFDKAAYAKTLSSFLEATATGGRGIFGNILASIIQSTLSIKSKTK